MAIMLGNKTGLSIENFFESPYAGKHPKLINKGTKEAAAEAVVTAAFPSPWQTWKRPSAWLLSSRL